MFGSFRVLHELSARTLITHKNIATHASSMAPMGRTVNKRFFFKLVKVHARLVKHWWEKLPTTNMLRNW